MKQDIESLLPGKTTEQGATRRTALKAAVGVGYAAAAGPIAAQTAIKTPLTGLASGTPMAEVENYPVPFYWAAPKDKKNLPVVLVIQEIFGLHEYIMDVCRRFAKAGYLAIAPDLYARQGDAGSYTDIGKLLAEVANKVPDAQFLADLDAMVAWAKDNGGNVNKLAVTGFCRGGRATWLYAAHNPKVKAAVAWYGPLVGSQDARTPKNPINLVNELKAPVLGLYGGQDGGIPLTTVNEMKDALAAAAAKGNKAAAASEFVVYPGVGHAFHADYRPSYNQAAAMDGFARTLAWFKDKGVS